MQRSIYSFTLLIKFKTKLLRIKARRQKVPFPQFWKSIKHPLGRYLPPAPGSFIRKKEGKTLSSDPFWQKAQRDCTVCVETFPHSSLLRAFIYPVIRNSVPFSKVLSSAKTWWKATDVPKIIPACLLSCFIFKGRRKDTERGKETKAGFKSSHHFALEQICLHMLRWPGRKDRASTFSLGWSLMWCSVALMPFTGSSCVWLPEQIEVIQATSGA